MKDLRSPLLTKTRSHSTSPFSWRSIRQKMLGREAEERPTSVRRRTVLHDKAEQFRRSNDYQVLLSTTPQDSQRRRKLTFFEAVGPGSDKHVSEEHLARLRYRSVVGDSVSPSTRLPTRSKFSGSAEEEAEQEIEHAPLSTNDVTIEQSSSSEGESGDSDGSFQNKLVRRATRVLQNTAAREALAGSAENGDLLDLFQATSSGKPNLRKDSKAERRKTVEKYKGLKKELTDDGTPVPSHGAKATELGRAQVPKPLPKKIEDDVGGESKLGAAFKLLKEDVLLIVFATLFSLGSTGLSLLSPQFSARIFDILAERNVSALPFGGNISLVSVEEGERISAHVVAQSFFIEEDSLFTQNLRLIVYVNIGSILLKALTSLCFGLAGRRIGARVRIKLMAAFLSKDAIFFDRRGAGELISRLNTDTNQLLALTTAGASLLSNVAILVGGSVAMFLTSWPLALIMFASLPVIAVSTLFVGRLMRRWTVVILKAQAQQTQVANELLSSSRSTRLFGRITLQLNSYAGSLRELYRWGLKMTYASVVYGMVTSSATLASQMMVLVIGAKLIFDPFYGLSEGTHTVLTIGTLVAFQRYGTMVRSSVGGLSGLWTQLLKAAAAAEIIIKLIEFSPDPPVEKLMSGSGEVLKDYTAVPSTLAYAKFTIYGRKSGGVTETSALIQQEGEERNVSVEKGIELQDVCFRYPTRPQQVIFRNLNLRMNFNEVCAIVGPSGSGKSTIFNLLSRQYEPDSGKIWYGGVPIQQIELRWLRKQFATVSQAPVIFSGSVAYNIAWGANAAALPGDVDMSLARIEMEAKSKKQKAGKQIEKAKTDDLEAGMQDAPSSVLGVPMDKIEGAARLANAHEFISKLPHGYNTIIGQRGTNLSGGQKQRLAIARAFLRDARILCLDEPTSALDPESERLVTESINKLIKGRTVIMITHRLTTSENANKIVVIAEGGVVEEGTHDELMSAEGLYYTQYKSVKSA